MMKINLKEIKKALFVGVFLAVFSSGPANAQDSAAIVNAVNQVRTAIEALFQTAAFYIFQVTPNIPETVETNYTRNHSTGVPIATQISSLNLSDFQKALNPDPNNL